MNTQHAHHNHHDHGGDHGHHAYGGPAPEIKLTGDEVVVDLQAEAVDWEIAPGRTVRGYGLNGRIPGPVIQATQGKPLAIRLTNRLPEPTVVH